MAKIKKSSFIVILCTAPTKALAHKIAKQLVQEKLAACVNISSPIRSIYFWKRKICEEKEFLLFIKSKKSLFSRLKKRVLQSHPYEIPEIIALPILAGNEDYLSWLATQTH